MQRMKWILGASGHYVSGCGRFEVGGVIWSKGGGRYVRLFDRATGREHCCRTEESAKAAARSLAKVENNIPI